MLKSTKSRLNLKENNFYSKAGPEAFKIRTDNVFCSLLREAGDQALEKIQGVLKDSV